jgi:2-polyprenyl-6-methoxyphenol hydroxylase-like FAD-dependent oxidoreductase
MTAIRKALVVGGGIGGLTAAIALRRRGIEVDLVEIKPVMTVYGVGIIQPNNTLRALDKIGLARACVEVGCAFQGWRIYDAAGNVLMDAPATSEAAPNFPPNNGITRPKLHHILTQAAIGGGAVLRFGITVDEIDDGAKGVDVLFTNGERGRYDLVIGSDGVYSDLRKRLFGALQPQFVGQGVWRYNLPRPRDLQWGALFNGPTSKVGLVPLSPTLMYMLIVTAEPRNLRVEGAHMAEEMRRRLQDYTSPLLEHLRPLITNPEEVVYRPLETLLLPAPWMKGRVLLIGDAAHSTTPQLAQGAAMAIEDAVLLGELLGRDAPLPQLLDEFMTRRFARVKFVVDSSVQIGAWELEDWQGIHNPEANPGGLLHSATLALMKDF